LRGEQLDVVRVLEENQRRFKEKGKTAEFQRILLGITKHRWQPNRYFRSIV
jgi:hypothetical protein